MVDRPEMCYDSTMNKVVELKVNRKDRTVRRESKFWQTIALQQQRILHAKNRT